MFICLLLLFVIAGCGRGGNPLRAEEAFLSGDFDGLIKTATKWSKNSQGNPLPEFLLSFASFVKDDFEGARQHRTLAFQDPARLQDLQNAVEAYAVRGATSVWAHLAIATLSDARNDSTKAMLGYERAAAIAPTNQWVKRCQEVARLFARQQEAKFAFLAVPKGKMQPLPGEWGRARPLDAQFSIQGHAESTVLDTSLRAELLGWDQLYSDGSRLSSVGWGVRAVSGALLLSSNDFHAIATGQLGYHLPMNFAIAPFDYLGRFITVRLAAEGNKSFLIPIGFYDEAKSVAGVTCNLEGNLYRKDKDSNVPVGVYINNEGKRVALNPHRVILELKDDAIINGSSFVGR